jgi:MoxR-like ATPase
MNLVPAALEAGVSTLILGHPGLGKSAFAAILAERYDLPLVDIRLAQQEPADLGGSTSRTRSATASTCFRPTGCVTS